MFTLIDVKDVEMWEKNGYFKLWIMLDKIIKDRSIIYLQSTQLGCKDVEIRKIKLVTSV